MDAIVAEDLTVTDRAGEVLVEGLDARLGAGQLWGVVESAAKRPALIDAVALTLGGLRPAGGGRLRHGRHELPGAWETQRARVGLVERAPVTPPQLELGRAVGYAAELRMEPGDTIEAMEARLDGVLEQLELRGLRERVVGELELEVRRRVDLAIELMGRPNVLVVLGPGAALVAHLARWLRGRPVVGLASAPPQQEGFDGVLEVRRGARAQLRTEPGVAHLPEIDLESE